jgi:hypothetical protein
MRTLTPVLAAAALVAAVATAAPAAETHQGMSGRHKMTGTVTDIDHDKGTVTLKTDAGPLSLHFPPSAVEGMKEGDKATVELAISPESGASSSHRGQHSSKSHHESSTDEESAE